MDRNLYFSRDNIPGLVAISVTNYTVYCHQFPVMELAFRRSAGVFRHFGFNAPVQRVTENRLETQLTCDHRKNPMTIRESVGILSLSAGRFFSHPRTNEYPMTAEAFAPERLNVF
jgi:hypothetical protein